MAGSKGGILHQHIVALVTAWAYWNNYRCISEDIDMMRYLNTRKKPDFILISQKDNSQFILGEVGDFKPCKWLPLLPVIHLGKNGRITLINADNTWNELAKELKGSLLSGGIVCY